MKTMSVSGGETSIISVKENQWPTVFNGVMAKRAATQFLKHTYRSYTHADIVL